MADSSDQRVIICGGGIVGCATAYFLALKGHKPLLVERCGVACAASGHAGGFLARGWGSGPTKALHEKGFDLHEQLARELDVASFRRLPTLSVSRGRRKSADIQRTFPWVDRAGAEMMDEGTAHVDPAEITQKMMDAAIGLGASVRIGTVSGVRREGERITAVVVDGEPLPCTDVVFAMGPWTCLVQEWLPEVCVPMEGVLSTSLTFNMPAPVEPACVLFCDEDEFGSHLEVNPRKDGTVYVCGCGGSKYLDNSQIAALPPDEVRPDPSRVKAATAALLAKTSLTGEIVPAANACIRPCPPDAKPILGKVLENVFLACGHNCWGILWGPLTGQIMSELVLDNPSPVALEAFDPNRFAKRASKRGRHKVDMAVGEQW